MGAAAALLVAALLAGCGAEPPDDAVGDPLPVDRHGDAAGRTSAEDELREQEVRAREASLRVRGSGCPGFGVVTGSAVALDRRAAVTNAHVVGSRARVEVAGWRGDEESVEAAAVSLHSDLAVLATHRPLPAEPLPMAEAAPGRGEVLVAGYPGGGAIEVERGEIVGVVHGSALTGGGRAPDVLDHHVLVIDARSIAPGSSGGPLIEPSTGEVVGVVFALATSDTPGVDPGLGLAVPIEVLTSLVERAGQQGAGFVAPRCP